jgi:hypothetical protein
MGIEMQTPTARQGGWIAFLFVANAVKQFGSIHPLFIGITWEILKLHHCWNRFKKGAKVLTYVNWVGKWLAMIVLDFCFKNCTTVGFLLMRTMLPTLENVLPFTPLKTAPGQFVACWVGLGWGRLGYQRSCSVAHSTQNANRVASREHHSLFGPTFWWTLKLDVNKLRCGVKCVAQTIDGQAPPRRTFDDQALRYEFGIQVM